MDAEHLDQLTRTFAVQSRRVALGTLIGGLLGIAAFAESRAAKRKKPNKKRKNKKKQSPIVCPPGTVLCGGETCANLLSDEAHCGTCETSCAQNQVCQAGTCFLRGTCPAALANPSFCAGSTCDTGGQGFCNCTTTTEGNVVCANNEVFCPTPAPCSSSADCSGGRVCIDVSGCCSQPLPGGTKTCLLPCPFPA